MKIVDLLSFSFLRANLSNTIYILIHACMSFIVDFA